jgi:Beta-galactosidase
MATHPRLRYPRLVYAAGAALVLLGTVVGLHLNGDQLVATEVSATELSGAGPSPAWGVLGGSCDEKRVAALRDAGVRLVELGVSWSEFEPQPEQFDQSYIAAVRDRITRCRNAGLGVVLTPGFQYAPIWVTQQPGAAYRDQQGGTGPAAVPNLVFGTAARAAAAAFLTRFTAEFPLNEFAAIRVGTSEAGELGYPGRVFGTPGNSFWAFDTAAQSGQGLPEGIRATPLPGWVPGELSWGGREVSPDDVRGWFDWYAESAARTVVWEIDLLRSLGFRGTVHMPLAGRGALPHDLAAATAAGLDGTADRDGSLERGLFYPDQLALIADATRHDARAEPDSVTADATGVGDSTAVTARNLRPPQDSCRASDASLPLRTMPGVELWSSTRWTIANARAAGLRVVGENPGPPTPRNGGDSTSDDLAGQLENAPRYAAQCGLEMLMWAFEDNLFAPDSGVSVPDLAQRIAG